MFCLDASTLLCGSRKYPFPHHGGSLGIVRVRGVLKAKIFKGMYEPNLEFPEGWGVQTKKTLHGGSIDIFWNNTLAVCLFVCFLFVFSTVAL